MADLTLTEKHQLEKALQMSSGYVLGFSNRTFAEFIHASICIDIYNGNYEGQGGSKASHLRCFWNTEPNHIVGRLLADLLSHGLALAADRAPSPWSPDQRTPELWDACLAIAERLKQGSIVENADVLRPNSEDKDFAVLARSIRDSLDRNEPQVAIDRLHTFCMKYARTLCRKHGLAYVQDEPLNAVFGKYVKHLEKERIVESSTAIFILKSTIGMLSNFNDVRNTKSLAHDNPVLNYQEALLIFNSIANAIKFVEHIEGANVTRTPDVAGDPFDDTPF